MITDDADDIDGMMIGDRGATNFAMDSWTFINVFTPSTKIQFNSVDCGIFRIRIVQLLRQSVDILSLCQDRVSDYRKELTTLIQNYPI